MIELYINQCLQEQSLKTLEQAVTASRQFPTDSQKTIKLGKGDYFINKTIQLDNRDNGLFIKADPNKKATLYGGVRISDWQQKDEHLWSTPIPVIENAPLNFRMLVVNDRMAQRSCLPESGYFIHHTKFDVLWKSTVEGGWERPATDDELLTLKYDPKDIGPWFDPKNAEITIFHMWDESLVGIDKFDPDNNTIRFSNKPGYPPGAFSGQYEMERRYVIWNLKEGLHCPGQWYLDRTAGEVVYWPLPEEDMQNAVVIAPTVENILTASGTENDPVQNITFEGFGVSTSNAPLMTGAFGAKLFDGAISIRHADHCTLKNLTIQNVAAHGIKAEGNHFTITDCEIKYTGASAIRYVGSDSLIQNNYIHHIGQVFPSAIALYIGVTDPNVPDEWESGKNHKNVHIAHNEIHDTPYTAIAAGGKNHIIENNLIYRAMQDLYDGAGIYVTFCKNIVIRNNIVRDIKESAGAGTSAYYLDEKSFNCLVESNISVNVARPMHNHISENNSINNNIFIIKGKGRFTIERSSDYIFTHNIVIADDDFALYDFPSISDFNNNIIFSKKGKLLARELDKYEITKTYELPMSPNNSSFDLQIKVDENGKLTYSQLPSKLVPGIVEIDTSRTGRKTVN